MKTTNQILKNAAKTALFFAFLFASALAGEAQNFSMLQDSKSAVRTVMASANVAYPIDADYIMASGENETFAASQETLEAEMEKAAGLPFSASFAPADDNATEANQELENLLTEAAGLYQPETSLSLEQTREDNILEQDVIQAAGLYNPAEYGQESKLAINDDDPSLEAMMIKAACLYTATPVAK